MAAFRYTAVHARLLLSLSRTEFQRWLAVLPPYCYAPTQQRSARQFSMRDLAFFTAIHQLQEHLGVPLRTMANFSNDLYAYFESRPTLAEHMPRLFLNWSADSGWRLEGEAMGDMSLVLNTAPIWELVHRFIGLDAVAQQRDLPLGLVAVPRAGSGKNRRG